VAARASARWRRTLTENSGMMRAANRLIRRVAGGAT
jgi:hypothetical protein